MRLVRAATELTLFSKAYDLGAALKIGVIGKTVARGRLPDEAVALGCFAPAQLLPGLRVRETRLAGDDDGRNRRRSAARSRLVIAWHARSCEPTRARAALPRAERGEITWALRLKNSRHRLVRVMHVGSVATEKVRSYPNCRRDAVAAQTSRRATSRHSRMQQIDGLPMRLPEADTAPFLIASSRCNPSFTKTSRGF